MVTSNSLEILLVPTVSREQLVIKPSLNTDWAIWGDTMLDWGRDTDHTLVNAVILFLKSSDGQSTLVGLVSLLRQGQSLLSPPGDGRCWSPTGTAGEGHLLPHRPHVLLLRPELDAGRVPHVDLHHPAGPAGPVGVVRGAGVVASVGLRHLKHN